MGAGDRGRGAGRSRGKGQGNGRGSGGGMGFDELADDDTAAYSKKLGKWATRALRGMCMHDGCGRELRVCGAFSCVHVS